MSALCSVGQKPKFIYAIPDFQNPTGVTMDLKRRQEIIDVARRHDLIIIEDSPYKELRYEGESYPTMYSMAPERVVLLGTFSKTFVPGFRLGWVLAPEEIIGRLIVAKQSADLCTPILNQEVAALYMEKGYYDKNLQTTIELYRHKRDLMHQYLTEYMPEGVTWTRPDEGALRSRHQGERGLRHRRGILLRRQGPEHSASELLLRQRRGHARGCEETRQRHPQADGQQEVV